ncbi:MAG: T9SS type A sorting domain-containing protein [Winogradskyella sp.]
MKKTLLLLTFLVFGFTQAQTVVYVDIDATGNNDGTSWANAYNSLHDALNNTNTAGAEVWIAEGTYTPSSASTPFLNQYGLNIYGGFVGTEVTKADRTTDPWLHPVYLSGDINGDDLIEVPSATSPNKSDNANRILQIEPTTIGGTTTDHVLEEIIIDRINFVNGYGGSSLYSHPATGSNFTQRQIKLRNCRFTRNYAATRPAFDVWSNEPGQGGLTTALNTFTMINSIVDENVSSIGYAFEFRGLAGYLETTLANNLFIANTVTDVNSSGSVARFISNGANNINVNFASNTLAFNQEGASYGADGGSCIYFQRVVNSGGIIGKWYNNIYYSNQGTGEYALSNNYSLAFIDIANTNARDFTTPTYDLPNSIVLTESPFTDVFTGDFTPQSAYRQNGTAANAAYNNSELGVTDCYNNARYYSGVSIIGLGAIQHSNAGMLYGPGNIASLSLPQVPGAYFVDQNATGANNGTSWADAFTSLYTALSSPSVSSGSSLYVKAGTYLVNSGPYVIADNSISIYGGFAGTESSQADRDLSLIFTSNATIIDGDINGDDVLVNGYLDANTADNANKLFDLTTDGVTIDGFVFKGANSSGNAIISTNTTQLSNFTLKNSEIKENNCSGLLFDWRNFVDNFKMYNTSIHHNDVNNGLMLLQTQNDDLSSTFVNVNIYDNNTNSDFGAIWFRTSGSATTNDVNIINCHFGGNVLSGMIQPHFFNISGQSTTSSLSIVNSIIYGNTNPSGNNTLPVDNSKTAEGDFTNLYVAYSIATGIGPYATSGNYATAALISGDPQLDSADAYKPTVSSNTVNVGDNSAYTMDYPSEDLLFNARIFNNTIDLGPYEYNPTLGVNNVSLNTNSVKLYPNPVSDRLFIKSTEQIEGISIYNINGQLIKQTIETTNGIDVSVLPSGLYMIEIKTNNNTINQKFLKG